MSTPNRRLRFSEVSSADTALQQQNLSQESGLSQVLNSTPNRRLPFSSEPLSQIFDDSSDSSSDDSSDSDMSDEPDSQNRQPSFDDSDSDMSDEPDSQIQQPPTSNITLNNVGVSSVADTMAHLVCGSTVDFPLHLHPNMKMRQKSFLQSINYTNIHKRPMAHCEFCKERWFDTVLTVHGPGRKRQCTRCHADSQTAQGIRRFSAANNMDPYPDADPRLPSTLSPGLIDVGHWTDLPKLSLVAQMMISPVSIYMKVYRLTGGAVHYQGQVLNVQQSNMPLLNVFPLLPNELPMVIIRKPGSSLSDLNAYKDFKINTADILIWLKFLKVHHYLFADLDIEVAENRASQLEVLSQDQGEALLSQIQTMEFEEDSSGPPPAQRLQAQSSREGATTQSAFPEQHELRPETGGATGTGDMQGEEPVAEHFLHLPIDPNGRRSEVESIRNIVDNAGGRPPILMFPEQLNFINDFTQAGLISAGFPTLFPFGKGDPTLGDRALDVTMLESMKHLMKYCVKKVTDDGGTEWHYPFVEDDRFVHWAQNTIERHRAQQQRGVLLHQNEEFANCSNEEMEQMLNEGGPRFEALVSKMQAFNANLNGSPQYLYKQRKSLEGIMEAEGMPTVWFTLSMADNHWEDLHSLFHRDEKGYTSEMPSFQTPQEAAKYRRKFVRANPHIVDVFFQNRVDDLIKHIFNENGLTVVWIWYRIEYQDRGAPHAHGCFRLKNAPDLIALSTCVVNGRKASVILNARDFRVPDDFTMQEIRFDEWLDETRRVTIDSPVLTDDAIAKLQSLVVKAKKAQKQITLFHDFLLSTSHPNPPTDAEEASRNPDTIYDPRSSNDDHPSSINPIHILNNEEAMDDFYCKSVNAQSRHKHQAYCDRNYVKRQKAIADKESQATIDAFVVDCRFDFPRHLNRHTTVCVKERFDVGSKTNMCRASIGPVCNDVWMNSHMRGIMEVWGANMDFQLITDAGMVIKYMTKYVTKAGGHLKGQVSKLMKKIFYESVVQGGSSVQSFIKKTMAKLLTDRLQSKQEKCHLLLGFPIVKSSLGTINIDLRNKIARIDIQNNSGHNDNNLDRTVRMSIVDAYAHRLDPDIWITPRSLENDLGRNTLRTMNLMRFCGHHYVGATGVNYNKIGIKANRVVPIFFPTISSTGPMRFDYCRYALMKYKPWLLNPNVLWGCCDDASPITISENWEAYIALMGDNAPDKLRREMDAYNRAQRNTVIPVYHAQEGSNGSAGDVPNVEDDVLLHDDGAIFDIVQQRDDEEEDHIIEWDEQHDWTNRNHPDLNEDEITVKLQRAMDGFSDRARTEVNYDTLSPEQKNAHDMVILGCTNTDAIVGNLQIIIGQGGCGKSYTIDAIVTSLKNKHEWTDDNFYLYATTGKAAANINGSTYQNYTDGLGINSRTKFSPLSSQTLQKFQLRFRGKCKLIIIDEYSMCGQASLHHIDMRLRQIMGTPDIPFGGIVVVLTGDPAQLPPVLANCLWDERAKEGSEDSQGHMTYHFFESVVRLTQNLRLDQNDAEAVNFDKILTKLRDGMNSFQQWQTITATCSESSLGPDAWNEHIGESPTHVYFTNKEVNQMNMKCLKEMNSPICRIDAEHTGRGHVGSSTHAEGLEKVLFLCIGAKVLLTKNLYQQLGLCNGAVGTVADIVYHSDTGEPIALPALPKCVMVDFGDDYTGPPLNDDHTLSRIVPIYPKEVTWQSPGGEGGTLRSDSRTMLPLKLSFAWTMWKLQGQTIRGTIVLHLGDREREHGLTYTGFSRVTKLINIAIAGGLSFERLTYTIRKGGKMKRRIKEEQRLKRLSTQTVRKIAAWRISNT